MSENNGENGGETGGENNGGGEGAWLDHVPEQYREWEEVKNASSLADVFQQYDNLRSYQGASIRIPGEDAGDEAFAEFEAKLKERVPGLTRMPKTAEEWTAFMSANTPEDVADYKVEVEGMDFDGERFDAMRAIAKKAGISATQFKMLFGGLAEDELKNINAGKQRHEAAMSELKGEWGAAFDEKTNQVGEFLKATDAPEGIRRAHEGGRFTAEDWKYFDALATQFMAGEGQHIKIAPKGNAAMTPAEATQAIAEIRANKDHPFNNPGSPGHPEALQKMLDLKRYQHPGTAGKDALSAA